MENAIFCFLEGCYPQLIGYNTPHDIKLSSILRERGRSVAERGSYMHSKTSFVLNRFLYSTKPRIFFTKGNCFFSRANESDPVNLSFGKSHGLNPLNLGCNGSPHRIRKRLFPPAFPSAPKEEFNETT